MMVPFYWPECDFLNQEWGQTPTLTFVVGASPEEFATKIKPHLTLDRDFVAKPDFLDRNWFHVSVDLKSVVPIPWHYPISQMWNGYSPFIRVKRDIESLTDLKDLKIPK